MTALCPSCGHNFRRDTPIISGPWSLTLSETHYDGARLALTRAESGTLYAIAKGAGRAISADAIGSRLTDTEEPGNLAAVMVCRLRKKLAVVPFVTEFGSGYRWAA